MCVCVCVRQCFGAVRTQTSVEDQVTVNPPRRKGTGANVEMKCHCVSPSLVGVATHSHLASAWLTISAAVSHNDKVA